MSVNATVATKPLVRDGRGPPPSDGQATPRQPPRGGALPWGDIRRVLLCRPNRRLGNQLFLTPLLAEIEARHPGTTVDIVGAGDGVGGLFRGYANVGRVFALPRNPFHAPGQYARAVRAFFGERYDLVIDPERRSRSARFFVSLCRATYRLGFSGDGDAGRLTHAVPGGDSPQHMSRRAVYLLRCASEGADASLEAPYPELDLRLTADERAAGAVLVAGALRRHDALARAPVIGLFANATGAKRYPGEWWQQLAARLRAQLPRAELLEILPPGAPAPSALALPAYRSSDLRQVAAVIGATSAFVSADCGTLHLACASGAPRVIGLFSVTDPAVYGPVGAGRRAIVTHRLAPDDVARAIAAPFLGGEADASLRAQGGGHPNLPPVS